MGILSDLFGSSGMSATLANEELEILHSLGWTNDAIDNMGQALVDDIISDYRRGILRKPGITVDTNLNTVTSGAVTPESPPEVAQVAGGIQQYDPNLGIPTGITLYEPSDVAIETFLTGFNQDLEDLAVNVAETTRRAGKAITELPGNLLLIIGGAVALMIFLRR